MALVLGLAGCVSPGQVEPDPGHADTSWIRSPVVEVTKQSPYSPSWTVRMVSDGESTIRYLDPVWDKTDVSRHFDAATVDGVVQRIADALAASGRPIPTDGAPLVERLPPQHAHTPTVRCRIVVGDRTVLDVGFRNAIDPIVSNTIIDAVKAAWGDDLQLHAH
jgi:hypothetical protein